MSRRHIPKGCRWERRESIKDDWESNIIDESQYNTENAYFAPNQYSLHRYHDSRKKKELQYEFDEYISKMKELQTKNNEITIKYHETANELKLARSEINALSQSLIYSQRDNKQQSHINMALYTENETLKMEISQIKQEYDELINQYDQLQNDLEIKDKLAFVQFAQNLDAIANKIFGITYPKKITFKKIKQNAKS